jgi:hypothetical protein
VSEGIHDSYRVEATLAAIDSGEPCAFEERIAAGQGRHDQRSRAVVPGGSNLIEKGKKIGRDQRRSPRWPAIRKHHGGLRCEAPSKTALTSAASHGEGKNERAGSPHGFRP